ncbi:MAG: peptidoglycan DD-metalloendopeptidase family protein [Chitinophagales bacterium]
MPQFIKAKILFLFLTMYFVTCKIDLFSQTRASSTKIYITPAFNNDKQITDTMQLFTTHWNNEITFPATTPLPDLDSVIIVLTDSMRYFMLPHYGRLNSGFGWRGNDFHKGLDINLEIGEPIKAAFDGKVRYAKYNKGGYGNLVIIRHFNGLETYYAHLSKIVVHPNDMIKAGQVIGNGGNSGAEWTGAHLHFEVRYLDHAMDPMRLIEFDSLRLKSDTLVLKMKEFNIKTVPNPPAKTTIAKSQYYIVKKGDTLSAIAKKNKTTVKKICSLNHIKESTVLQIGKKLRVN